MHTMKELALKKSVLALGIASALALPVLAVETVVFSFGDGEVSGGWARDYGGFGGFDNVGKQIVETRIIIDFEPTNGFNAADFYSGFLVPVILDDPSNSEYMQLWGAELGWSGTTGRFTLSIATDDFNGVIRPGRFGWEFYSANEFDPSISGIFRGDSRFEFDLVPAPGALTLLGAGALAMGRRRR